MTRLAAILSLSLVPLIVSAQDRLSAPRLGAVLFSDGTLGTLEGVPGAARFIRTPDSPRHDALLMASHAQAGLLSTGTALTVFTPTGHSLLHLAAPPAALAISPTGTYLALILGTDLAIYDVASLATTAPQITSLASLPLDSTSPSLSISDHGTAIVSTIHNLTVVRTSGYPELASLPLALPRFRPGSETAVAYSPDQRALITFDTRRLTTERLLTTTEGLSEPTGIEVADSVVWVSQQGPNSAIRYSLDTRSATTFQFAPDGALRSLGTPGVYLWGATSLLDTRRDVPRVLLIATTTEAP